MYPLDEDPEDHPDAQKLIERAGEDLDEALQAIGVYVRNKGLSIERGPEGDMAVLRIEGMIGAVAFSDRVLRPQAHGVDVALDEIEAGMIEDDAQERIDRLFGGLRRSEADDG